MLRPQPKEKERRRVEIPVKLRDAIREAHVQITESQRDPDVRVDYDDAIQCGCLIGGRIGTRKRPFEFTYYPDGDCQAKSGWHLALHPLEIEDIADGMLDIQIANRCQRRCGVCFIVGACGVPISKRERHAVVGRSPPQPRGCSW